MNNEEKDKLLTNSNSETILYFIMKPRNMSKL